MASTIDLEDVARRARVAYERRRVVRALLGSVPILLVASCAACANVEWRWSAGLGCLAYAVGALMLWYGRGIRASVLAGVGAGMVPLALVFFGRQFGHACSGASCSTVCMQACSVGGFVAGVVIGLVGARRPSSFWIGASLLALLTGAMGCACLGLAGVAGVAAGLGAAVVPLLVARAFLRRLR